MKKATETAMVRGEKPAAEPIEEAAPAAPALLPLDQVRVIVLKSPRGPLTYTFRRIVIADWQAFFAAVVNQTLQRQGVREAVYESETAQLQLVEKTLTAVEGYGDLSKLKDWKKSLPLKHRLAVGSVLRGVGEAAADADAPLSDLVEIRLDGYWSAGADGRTALYSGLVHRFRQPSIEQLKKFNFETARVRAEGDSSNGVTSYPSRQLVAMRIYDELIEEVDGYAAAGAALTGIENICREMDGAHKAEAALALFSQGDSIRVQ
jgi:hypothetical protein